MNEDMNIGQMLAEQMEKLFTETVNRDLFILVEAGQPASALWNELEALGITSALVSEAAGGAGLTWADTEPTLRAIGRHGSPVPLAETMLAQWALANVQIDLPTGTIAISTQCFELDADNNVTGTDTQVSWLPACKHVVATAHRNGEYFLFLLAHSEKDWQSNDTIAREPNAQLILNATTPTAIAACTLGAQGLLPYLATIRSIQIAGALEQLLDLSVEYGNTREQFGRPIGKFQAIQHAIAQLATQTAAAQVGGLYACRQIDVDNAIQGAMVAKTRAGAAAGLGAEIAHQVFGAIGFTDEHSLHYFTRRLWQWRSEAGSEYWWAEQLGSQVIANGGDALWPSISN
jgi:acyl-CoA dehydrogenase